MGDRNGDYARFPELEDLELGRFEGIQIQCSSRKWSCWRWWAKVVALCVLLTVAAALLILWAGPLLIQKVVIPILNWETATFNKPILGLLLFASIAVFPALFLPSAPSMWIAGMTFGYGYGFLLIMAGTSIGMSLPFFIGSLIRYRIHEWIDKWPEKAVIIRLAGEGNWFHQFRAVTLLRISPFPYIIFNYAAVATNVKYGPYISGSLVGTVPEIFLTIYSGILIRNLADATNKGHFLSLQQVIYDGLGLFAALSATAAITIYSKRSLQNLKETEDLSSNLLAAKQNCTTS